MSANKHFYCLNDDMTISRIKRKIIFYAIPSQQKSTRSSETYIFFVFSTIRLEMFLEMYKVESLSSIFRGKYLKTGMLSLKHDVRMS